jgi:hypothetical protein
MDQTVTVSLTADDADALTTLLDHIDLHDYAMNPGYYGFSDDDGKDVAAAGAKLLDALNAALGRKY